MNRQQIEDKAITILAAVLKCDVDCDTSRENTPQWDSLKHVEILFALEEELGVEFSEQQMTAIGSVRDIADQVLTLHAA